MKKKNPPSHNDSKLWWCWRWDVSPPKSCHDSWVVLRPALCVGGSLSGTHLFLS